jgi:4-aminobutyrate aminotransferase-like enzyme
MLKVFAFDASGNANLDPVVESMIERRKALLGPAYQLFYKNPLHLVKGRGARVYDAEGTEYLDLYNNVPSVGHCHPRVIAAIHEQASAINTHTRYLHDKVLAYAERLLGTLPKALAHVMFTCTASEANDLALRVARDFTGGTGVIVTEYAYHGITASVAEVSPSMGAYVALGKDVRTVRVVADNTTSVEAAGTRFAAQVRSAIDDLKRHGIKPAALLLDTIFHSDGILPDPAGFLREAVELVHKEGAIFIADEVQPGFGRTGTHMWGFERHGVLPDIVTMGKPMGNGHPIGGLAVKPHVIERFAENAAYFNTFGGNPVSAAAGLAVLDVIEDERLMENAARVGAFLKTELASLAAGHPNLVNVRGAGLFVGVDLIGDDGAASPALANRFVNDLREHGVLIGLTGPKASSFKIRPPMCLTLSEAGMFMEILTRCLR